MWSTERNVIRQRATNKFVIGRPKAARRAAGMTAQGNALGFVCQNADGCPEMAR